MKVIVITRFKDKYTKMWHPVNENLNVDEKRFEEIKKFVKIKPDDKTKEKESSKNKKERTKGESLTD